MRIRLTNVKRDGGLELPETRMSPICPRPRKSEDRRVESDGNRP